jgi:hypothetical protein
MSCQLLRKRQDRSVAVRLEFEREAVNQSASQVSRTNREISQAGSTRTENILLHAFFAPRTFSLPRNSSMLTNSFPVARNWSSSYTCNHPKSSVWRTWEAPLLTVVTPTTVSPYTASSWAARYTSSPTNLDCMCNHVSHAVRPILAPHGMRPTPSRRLLRGKLERENNRGMAT